MNADTNKPAPVAEPASEPDAAVEKAWARFCLENCRLFAARHRKEEWAQTILRFCAEAGVTGSSLAAASNGSPGGAWVPVTERMPASGVTVLACYTNSAGNVRRIRAEWIAAKTIESDTDSEISEYDEATDCFYDPEGWYEKIDNWGDYSSVAVVEGEVTHWMPLPAPPQLNLGADGQMKKD